MSNYQPFKDYETLLSVFSKIYDYNKNVRFVLIGRGNTATNKELMALIESNNLSGKVKLLGSVKNVASHLRSFDIFLLTSILEGFPNVLIEAMASGVPVVATNVGESMKIIDNKIFIKEPGDSVGLAESCNFVLSMDKESRKSLGKSFRKRVIANFSKDYMIANYENLYNKYH